MVASRPGLPPPPASPPQPRCAACVSGMHRCRTGNAILLTLCYATAKRAPRWPAAPAAADPPCARAPNALRTSNTLLSRDLKSRVIHGRCNNRLWLQKGGQGEGRSRTRRLSRVLPPLYVTDGNKLAKTRGARDVQATAAVQRRAAERGSTAMASPDPGRVGFLSISYHSPTIAA